MKSRFFLAVLTAFVPFYAFAAPLKIAVNKIDENGVGEKIGHITIKETKAGLVFKVDVKAIMPEGNHGFHLHENPNCGADEKDGKKVAGLLAGSHLDPHKTAKHEGPEGQGHLGDLPFVVSNQKGEIKMSVVAKRLKMEDVMNRSLIIHGGSDNYADKAGGDRVACAVIQ